MHRVCVAHADDPPDGGCPAGQSADDVTPEGVRDLAGNLNEWTIEAGPPHRFLRDGRNWASALGGGEFKFGTVPKQPIVDAHLLPLGGRCAADTTQ